MRRVRVAAVILAVKAVLLRQRQAALVPLGLFKIRRQKRHAPFAAGFRADRVELLRVLQRRKRQRGAKAVKAVFVRDARRLFQALAVAHHAAGAALRAVLEPLHGVKKRFGNVCPFQKFHFRRKFLQKALLLPAAFLVLRRLGNVRVVIKHSQIKIRAQRLHTGRRARRTAGM